MKQQRGCSVSGLRNNELIVVLQNVRTDHLHAGQMGTALSLCLQSINQITGLEAMNMQKQTCRCRTGKSCKTWKDISMTEIQSKLLKWNNEWLTYGHTACPLHPLGTQDILGSVPLFLRYNRLVNKINYKWIYDLEPLVKCAMFTPAGMACSSSCSDLTTHEGICGLHPPITRCESSVLNVPPVDNTTTNSSSLSESMTLTPAEQNSGAPANTTTSPCFNVV